MACSSTTDGHFYAVRAASGKRAWTADTGVPAVYKYSTVLAPQALDAGTGDPLWSFTAPDNSEFPSTPAVANGLVLIGCYDDAIYAVEA